MLLDIIKLFINRLLREQTVSETTNTLKFPNQYRTFDSIKHDRNYIKHIRKGSHD